MCSLAVLHAGDRLSPPWRLAFSALGGARRWVFLPMLSLTVPLLVMIKGGDAMSVCFNTVAVLFLCDIDHGVKNTFLEPLLY